MVVVIQKPISDMKKMQYLKRSLTGQAKATISGMGFSSQSYYLAWDILCEKYGRSNVIVIAQFRRKHTHRPIRHKDSTSIVKFAILVTNMVKTLTQLGYTSDLEAELGLSSTTRNFCRNWENSGCSICKIVERQLDCWLFFEEWLAS